MLAEREGVYEYHQKGPQLLGFNWPWARLSWMTNCLILSPPSAKVHSPWVFFSSLRFYNIFYLCGGGVGVNKQVPKRQEHTGFSGAGNFLCIYCPVSLCTCVHLCTWTTVHDLWRSEDTVVCKLPKIRCQELNQVLQKTVGTLNCWTSSLVP